MATRTPPLRPLSLAEVLSEVSLLADEVAGRSMLLMGRRHDDAEACRLACAAALALAALRDSLPEPEGG